MRFWGEEYKEELLGKPYWLLIKSNDVVKDIATAMFKNDSWEGELVATRKNGEEVIIRVSAGMVRDEHGNPIQTISSFLDITELKILEEEKQRMEEQLQITGRLAAVGELTAGVAHELNNPLAAIQAYAELLSERDDLDETTKSDVETIYKEAKRASRITSNLLSFARRYKPEKSLISINDVIRKSLELHAYRMKVNNIEIVTDLDPDLPMLMADFHQMQQVFVNIITNAEQAMTKAHGKGKLIVKTQEKGNVIQIIFSDDGPGISEEDLKSIFNPFFTTKEVGEGTGLGLSICYGIVQEHGSALYAKSKLGDGATFTVEMPIVQEQALDEQVDLTVPWSI
jgi:two-component system NtrC family sensor kinase